MSVQLKPTVLVLSLEMQDMYTSICAHFRSALAAEANVLEVTTAASALAHLEGDTKIAAVVSTDPGITEKKNSKVLQKLQDYVKEKGGTVILGAQFSSFISPNGFNAFIRRAFGLEWTFGSYYRAVFSLNPALEVERLKNNPKLVDSYSQKAISLKGVSSQYIVYKPTEESHIQSQVFAPTPVEDPSEAPVAFAKVGNGYVGWVGDVNAENETTGVMLAMCGL